MSSPSIGATPKDPAQPPSLLDPTVQYARVRTKQKALQATGRGSTILSSSFAPMMPTGSTGGSY